MRSTLKNYTIFGPLAVFAVVCSTVCSTLPGCAPVEHGASKAFDNAAEAIRTGDEKLWYPSDDQTETASPQESVSPRESKRESKEEEEDGDAYRDERELRRY